MQIQKTLAIASLITVPFLTGCGMWRQQTGAVYAPQAYATPPAYTLPQQQPQIIQVPAPQVAVQQPQPIYLQTQQQVAPAAYYSQAPAGNACCNPCCQQ